MLGALLIAAALAQAPAPGPAYSTATGQPASVPTAATGKTINLVSWSGNQLPKIYERSSQLPLTDADLVKLSKAGFSNEKLVAMIQQRRCACDASADGMIRLKKAGVSPDVIAAISLHALAPNRALNLDVTLDFTGRGNQVRDSYLYVFVDDGELTRVLTANLGELLGRRNAHETRIDRSDRLLPYLSRRIELPGQLALKHYGKHVLIVATSANPTLTMPSQLSPKERAHAQTYAFDYPRESLQSVCRLTAGYKRDAVLTYRWHYQGSHFECEWN